MLSDGFGRQVMKVENGHWFQYSLPKITEELLPVYHVVKWVSVQPRPDMYKWRPFLPICAHVYKKLRNNTASDPV